jgi:hypothetical protein
MGLTNAPAVFQAQMNHMFGPHLHRFVCISLDDILISSKTEDEHFNHLQKVLDECYFFGRQSVRGRQKINCLGFWRQKTVLFGGGWRPEGRQTINSTGKLWH